MEPETAGDPMSGQKWVRSSLRELSLRLEQAQHPVSHTTVGRLLDKLGYALHVNAKKVEANANHADRGEQFEYIAAQRAAFQARARAALDPPESAQISSRRAPGERADPSQRHQRRSAWAANAEVSWSVPTETHPVLAPRS